MQSETETSTEPTRETLASWVSRRAAHYWVDMQSFCTDKGTSFTAVMQKTDEAIQALSEHGVSVPTYIREWSPLPNGRGTRSLRGHSFPTKSLQTAIMRGCLQCLREDAKKDGAMKMRGHWLVPHVSMCLIHNTPLVPLWREANMQSRFDSVPKLAEREADILSGKLDGEGRGPLPFDEWLDARLAGAEFPETWLDKHPLHAACNFCRLLGTARLRLEGIPPSRMTQEDRPILYEMGFQVARHGRAAIIKTFEALQRKPGSPHEGPKAIYPVLYDRLAYDYRDHPDYAPFRALLREHMLATWPLGPGDDLLGEPVRGRRLHSVRTAAQATGVDQRRLRKALAAAHIVPDAENGLPDAWEVFDAEEVVPILEGLTEMVTAKDMAVLINATRSQFDLLVADGVLVPDLQAADVKTVWHPDQGRRFLESILTGARQLRQAQHGWEHISRSAQRLKTGPGKIISAIRDGRITQVGNRMEREGYAAVHVYHDEVVAALRPDPIDARSIAAFAKAVGIPQPSILKRMIDDGHVGTTRLVNPITKAQQDYFTPADEAAFLAEFATPTMLARERGMSWQKIVRTLRDASVEPVGGRDGPYGNVYRRRDVEANLS